MKGALVALVLAGAWATQAVPQRPATYPTLPSETPAQLNPVTDAFTYASSSSENHLGVCRQLRCSS